MALRVAPCASGLLMLLSGVLGMSPAWAGSSDRDPKSAFFSPDGPLPMPLPLPASLPLPAFSRHDRRVAAAPRMAAPVPDISDLSTGSGVVLGSEGPVLTNAHVVQGCKQVSIILPDHTSIPASVSNLDPVGDLALLKAPLHNGLSLRLRSGPIAREEVWATGYAHGYPNIQVLSGPASAAGDHTGADAFRVNAAIEGGDSGGAVLDGNGDLVGLVYGTAPGHSGGYAVEGWKIRAFLNASGVSMPVADALPSTVAPYFKEHSDLITLRIFCNNNDAAPETVAVSAPLPQQRGPTRPQGIEPSAVAPD